MGQVISPIARLVPNDLGSMIWAWSRPETVGSYVQEGLTLARMVAWYPFGLADELLRPRPSADKIHTTPVILVHGYAHNRSGWSVLRRHLRKAGYGNVTALNYNAFSHDIRYCATQLAAKVDEIKRQTGAPLVHLIGHSLGGVVVRWYVQVLGGNRHVHTAVTIASPHEGTKVAEAGRLRHLVPGELGFLPVWETIDEMTPASHIYKRLAEPFPENQVRWIAYYSNTDALVVPASSAKLRHPDLDASNLLAKDLAHLSVMVAPDLAASVVGHLERRWPRRHTSPNYKPAVRSAS